jgi:hypothetical protein
MPTEKDTRTLLAEAIRKRDELNTFIKVLQEMSGATAAPDAQSADSEAPDRPSPDVGDPASVVYPGMFFGKTQPQAARLLLDRVHRPLKTRIIVELLEKGGMTVGGKKPAINLWGILDRNREIFILVPKAGWGLVDWYEPSVIAKMRKDKDSTGEGDSDAA